MIINVKNKLSVLQLRLSKELKVCRYISSKEYFLILLISRLKELKIKEYSEYSVFQIKIMKL